MGVARSIRDPCLHHRQICDHDVVQRLRNITDLETMMHRLPKNDKDFSKSNAVCILEQGRAVYIPFGGVAVGVALEKTRASCPKAGNSVAKPGKKEEKKFQSLLFIPVLSPKRDVEQKVEPICWTSSYIKMNAKFLPKKWVNDNEMWSEWEKKFFDASDKITQDDIENRKEQDRQQEARAKKLRRESSEPVV